MTRLQQRIHVRVRVRVRVRVLRCDLIDLMDGWIDGLMCVMCGTVQCSAVLTT